MNVVDANIDPGLVSYALNSLQRYFPVTPEQGEYLIHASEVRQFNKKTIVLNEGEMERYLNMVVSGLVRKYVRKGKSEFTVQLATEGHIIHSEISFLRKIPSPVIIETIEPTIMLALSFDSLEYLMEKMPGGNKMGRQLLVAMLVKKDERHYKHLHLSTRERFLEYMNNHPHMLQRVPQKYLASYLNIMPETFSRLKHLVKLK